MRRSNMVNIEYSVESIKKIIPNVNEYKTSDSEELRVIAMDVLKSVANCDFKANERLVLIHILKGYSQSNIADKYNMAISSVSLLYKRACKKICIYLVKSC